MEQHASAQPTRKIFKENKAASILLENYVGTVLYTVIVHNLNDKFPDWRKNHELGEFAPLFLLFIIDYQKEYLISDELEQFLFVESKIIRKQYKAYKLANSLHNHREIQAETFKYIKDNSVKNMQLKDVGLFAVNFLNYFKNIIYWPY